MFAATFLYLALSILSDTEPFEDENIKPEVIIIILISNINYKYVMHLYASHLLIASEGQRRRCYSYW